jgi:hypothetical protein
MVILMGLKKIILLAMLGMAVAATTNALAKKMHPRRRKHFWEH